MVVLIALLQLIQTGVDVLSLAMCSKNDNILRAGLDSASFLFSGSARKRRSSPQGTSAYSVRSEL